MRLIIAVIWLFGTAAITDAAGGITEITLHYDDGIYVVSRNGGPFYPISYTLTLRSDRCAFFDGGSDYLGPGHFTSDTLAHDDFVHLAQEVTSLGFYNLALSYGLEPPTYLVDADELTISVKRNNDVSSVSSQVYEGTPKALTSLSDRINSLGAGLVWVDDKTLNLADESGDSSEDAYAAGVLARCHR